MGVTDNLLAQLPLWLSGILVFGLSLLAHAAGALLYRRSPGAARDEAESDSGGYLISGVFGLHAFMIGITFSIAVDRFDARRELVVEEANAIRTTYLRSTLLDEPSRTQIRSLLHRYAQSRIAPDAARSSTAADARFKQASELEAQLWAETVRALYPIRETDLASYFVEAMNETFATAAARKNAALSHIPSRIYDLLLFFTIAAAAVTGFLNAGGNNRLGPASIFLLALFTLTIMLIISVDRPLIGAVPVPQVALQDVVEMMNRDSAETRAGGPSSY